MTKINLDNSKIDSDNIIIFQDISDNVVNNSYLMYLKRNARVIECSKHTGYIYEYYDVTNPLVVLTLYYDLNYIIDSIDLSNLDSWKNFEFLNYRIIHLNNINTIEYKDIYRIKEMDKVLNNNDEKEFVFDVNNDIELLFAKNKTLTKIKEG